MRQHFEQSTPVSEKAAVLSCRELIARSREIDFQALYDASR